MLVLCGFFFALKRKGRFESVFFFLLIIIFAAFVYYKEYTISGEALLVSLMVLVISMFIFYAVTPKYFSPIGFDDEECGNK